MTRFQVEPLLAVGLSPELADAVISGAEAAESGGVSPFTSIVTSLLLAFDVLNAGCPPDPRLIVRLASQCIKVASA